MSSPSKPEPIRVLLFTVTPPETRALYDALKAIGRQPQTKNIDGFSYQDFGKVSEQERIGKAHMSLQREAVFRSQDDERTTAIGPGRRYK